MYTWIHLKEAQKPGQQLGITPSALLCQITIIAPPEIMSGKMDPCISTNTRNWAGDYDFHVCHRSGVLEEQMACKGLFLILYSH